MYIYYCFILKFSSVLFNFYECFSRIKVNVNSYLLKQDEYIQKQKIQLFLPM